MIFFFLSRYSLIRTWAKRRANIANRMRGTTRQLCALKHHDKLILQAPTSTYKFQHPHTNSNIHIQILQTDLQAFPLEISWENLLKDQSIFSLMITLLILVTFSRDCVLILFGENWCWSVLRLKGLWTLTFSLNWPARPPAQSSRKENYSMNQDYSVRSVYS